MAKTIRSKIVTIATVICAIVLVLVPFHALLTIWLASIFGHYTAWRLWDEVALIIVFGLAGIIALRDPKLKRWLGKQHLTWLIGLYALLQILLGVITWLKGDVTTKALGYAWIVDLRFLLFFIACLVVTTQTDWLKRHWRELLLIPAAIVVGFGLLQHFVLPANFLSHFGYGATTILPAETINHNAHYVRIISTLRGANPLGAYLVVVSCAVTVMLLRSKELKWRILYSLFLVATAVTLFYSYSRSAYVGAAIGVLIIIWLSIKSTKQRYWIAATAVLLIILLGSTVFALRNNTRLENIFTHTQQHSAIKTTSDQGHLSAFKNSIKVVARHPLGSGPGTSGPASAYTKIGPNYPENYFLQIAEEVGWLGLVIFLLILWLITKGLWIDRYDPLALTLLAALAGVTFVNLLSQAWTDDTLAYIWWGLAGVALAQTIRKRHEV